MSLRKVEGIWPVNSQCASSLPGLFAAGDALGNMQNGAVYSLSGLVIGGYAFTVAKAGITAAMESVTLGAIVIDDNEVFPGETIVACAD